MGGTYIIGYIKTKEERLLNSVNAIKNAILKICGAIGFNVVEEKYYVFKNPNGITYCFILSQSHFVVHTWPEEHKIFFDIFTCNKKFNEKKCIKMLSKEFKGNTKGIRKIMYK